ncbi:PREDICTED: D-aspartate oxidase [Nicrophorus vespilloides]|uniref:D-aspartate oxidase n=1 Tax=Nicrophorus vespilloides TaxID=110193 RepID=A0ABM1N9R1_NICVS|nr:PREDICTED: D-aspartate oxidase [Nicrophorus vespilloides]
MLKVAVVGAGVIGLTTALEVQKKLGHRVAVTIYTSDVSPNTTGDVSAGLWTPYLLQETPETDVMRWSKVMHDYIHDLWKTGFAEEAGISLQSMIHLITDANEKLPGWGNIAFGFTELTRKQLDQLGSEHKKYYAGGFTFVSFTCEPCKLLPFLQKQFLSNGGELIMRKVYDLEEFAGKHEIVVNCAGLGAQDLLGDKQMQAIRGQVARVRAPWQFNTIMEGENYIIVNMDCVVLGGTHQENDFDLSPKDEDKRHILNGCCNLVPSLQKSEVLKHMVGLRPGRPKVRIEMERKIVNGKPMIIVHNYGHGGSGVTLCVGCAKDACQLVQEGVSTICKSKL